MKKMLTLRVGDVENDDALNEKASPFYHAKKIKSPLLIAQVRCVGGGGIRGRISVVAYSYMCRFSLCLCQAVGLSANSCMKRHTHKAAACLTPQFPSLTGREPTIPV